MATITKRILLINGDTNIQEIMQAYLTDFGGWQVRSTTSPLLALNSAAQDKPDAILFDLSTYGMNFFTFLKRLRSQVDTQTIPVILIADEITGFNSEILQELGVIGFINYYTSSANFSQQVANFLKWDEPC